MSCSTAALVHTLQDFFFVCPGHLKDRGFCSPIIDEAAVAAKKKKEMEAEVERVKQEFEEKQKKRVKTRTRARRMATKTRNRKKRWVAFEWRLLAPQPANIRCGRRKPTALSSLPQKKNPEFSH